VARSNKHYFLVKYPLTTTTNLVQTSFYSIGQTVLLMAKSYHNEISTSWIRDLIIKPSVITKVFVYYTAAFTYQVQGCG
jgi:hypothetical protein